MSKSDLAVPSIHLNGTGKDELVRQLSEAHQRLQKAREALALTAPHMRDYYVQLAADHNYRRARNQHEARLQKIDDVMTDLLDLGIFIQEGGYQGDRKG